MSGSWALDARGRDAACSDVRTARQAGLAGVIRMRNLGQDDHAAWLLIPLFGAMVVVAMLSTIVLGLTTDERWAERRGQPLKATRWAPVIAVVIAMLLGGAALMGTLAFSGQMFFEYQKLT